jgi:hypothetical protein
MKSAKKGELASYHHHFSSSIMPDPQNYDDNEPMPMSIDPEVYYTGSKHDWDAESPSVANFPKRYSHLKDGRLTTAQAHSDRPQNNPPHFRVWDSNESGLGHRVRQSSPSTKPPSCQTSLNSGEVENRLVSTPTQPDRSSSKATLQPPCPTTLERHGFLKHDDAESLRRFLERQQQGPTEIFSSDVLRRVESLAGSQGVTKESLPDRTAAFPPRGARQG